MSLILHKGGQFASIEEIQEIPVPPETNSYKPVSHYELVVAMAIVGNDMLGDYQLCDSQYGLARDGAQLFAVHTYRNGDESDLRLAVGFRNSYDRSLSIGVATGASVLVCDNLCFAGDVSIMRKHTTNVKNDLEQLIVGTLYRARSTYHQILTDAEHLKSWQMSDDDAFKLLGLAYGHGIVTPRQVPVVKREWIGPSHDEFSDRNAWSFYNAVTEALKTTPPAKKIERHIQLHKLLDQA